MSMDTYFLNQFQCKFLTSFLILWFVHRLTEYDHLVIFIQFVWIGIILHVAGASEWIVEI